MTIREQIAEIVIIEGAFGKKATLRSYPGAIDQILQIIREMPELKTDSETVYIGYSSKETRARNQLRQEIKSRLEEGRGK